MALTFQAASIPTYATPTTAAVWPIVQVRVDGVAIASVTVNTSAYVTYTVNVPNFVALQNHTIDFVYANDDGLSGAGNRTLWLRNPQVNGAPLGGSGTADGGLIDQGSGAAAFDGLSVIDSSASADKIQELNGTLRYVSSAHQLLPYWAAAAQTQVHHPHPAAADGRLLSEAVSWPASTTTTTIAYDKVGRLLGSTADAGTVDARTRTQRFDLQGRL